MTDVRVLKDPDTLFDWRGQEVACSDWITVSQKRIVRFAEVTGDHQWIHVDVERAQRESSFGSTIAHGYLTLSLLPTFFESCLRIEQLAAAINYGLDRVRFPAPVLAGQRVRGRLVLERAEPIRGGVQAHWTVTVEIEDGDKPACVAQMLVRYHAFAEIPG